MKAIQRAPYSTTPDIAMPAGPVVDTAAWVPGDFPDPSVWQYRFDAAELAELGAAVSHVRKSNIPLIEVDRANFPLPTLSGRLTALRHEVTDGRGFILLRGLPVDDYSRDDLAVLYWGIGLYFGYPVSQNGRGHLLGHVVGLDKGESLKKQGSENQGERRALDVYNSRSQLNFQVDLCDIVGLFCLHPAMSGGLSMIASSVTIHNEIMKRRPDLLEVLYQPLWTSRMEELPAGTKPYYPMPVFHWVEGRLTTHSLPGFVRNAERIPEAPRLTDKQREAMDFMNAVANEPGINLPMQLEKGDVQFINNHVTLHTRTAWEDFPEPERKRHLLRLWLVTPEARPLSDWIHDFYTAGRRGGVYVPGMREVATLDV